MTATGSAPRTSSPVRKVRPSSRGAQHLEELRGGLDSGDQPGRAVPFVHGHVTRPVRGHGPKAGELVAQVEVLLLLGPPTRAPEGDHLIRVRVRQRIEMRGASDAENRRRPADPEREGEHREHRVAGPAPQPPRAVARIRDPVLQHSSSGLICVCGRFVAGPAPSPGPSEKRARGGERLTPHPASGRVLTLASDTARRTRPRCRRGFPRVQPWAAAGGGARWGAGEA